MNGQLMRQVLRWIHILCALLVGAALYSPLKTNEAFMTLVLFILVPLVAITGVMMWKQGKVMKFINRNHKLEQSSR
ncbi:hypothetical protein [Vibrio alfacsensis]|uniref:hypothetical protein n=1 Tax=Vibrio alfacsensis TaxID=1074311 RepID=UPI001BEDF464|nr:hypothetical protein [Vibrio alfacsensis]BBM67409.1 hypothetical protein VA249_40550 [Vibrio alfacsensis]BCN26782.1 hypothetical protein VYA_39740 [Vibrio alfacsensis]